jgi:hypothetical protein
MPNYLSQVYFAFYPNSIFSPLRSTRGIETNFCHFSIRRLYSVIEFSVLITNITFFLKLCRIIIKVSHSFDIYVVHVFIFLCQFQIKHPSDFIGSTGI